MKKALAMKCTQEQWDSIKGRIPENKINAVSSFEIYPYLINFDDEKTISNISTAPTWKKLWKQKPTIHEKFNAKIFLDACGIETDVYKITKEQVLELSKMNCVIKEKFCDLFPDAFKKELEVGKWYKSLEYPKQIVFVVGFETVQRIKGYGFDTSGNWEKDNNHFSWGLPIDGNFEEATPQEVEDALICEAKKRGFKKGARYLSAWNNEAYCIYPQDLYYNAKKNCLATHDGNKCIFQNGQWATIIQPEKMTLEQIEKELGRKIEIV